MGQEYILNSLFDAHTKDLQDIRPDLVEVVVCPICLRIFPRDAILSKHLTVGYVWPKGLRKFNQDAFDMKVLLCKDCNNSVGSRGDKQMQLLEKIRKGDKTEWHECIYDFLMGKSITKIHLEFAIKLCEPSPRIAGRLNLPARNSRRSR